MDKEKSPKQNTKPSSSNPFDDLHGNPNLKKPTTDYAQITIEALKRLKD